MFHGTINFRNEDGFEPGTIPVGQDATSGQLYIEIYEEGTKIKGSVNNLAFPRFPGETLNGRFTFSTT